MKIGNKVKCIVAAMLAALVTVSGSASMVAFAAETGSTPAAIEEESNGFNNPTGEIISGDDNSEEEQENTLAPVTVDGESTIVAEGECGADVTWALDEDGLLTISGSGSMYGYKSGSETPWYSNRTKIKSVVIEEGVTSIGNYAFCAATNLSSVTIPEGVTTIGTNAFYCCTALTSITIPASVTVIHVEAFQDCSGLKTVTFAENSQLEDLSSGAFSYCTSLETITFTGNAPDTYSGDVDDIFEDCPSTLKIIATGTNPTGYDVLPWSDMTVEMPNKVQIILSGECGDNLTWALDEDGLLTISGSGEMWSFASAAPWESEKSSIKTVVIEDGVTSIGYSVFKGCSGLTSVTIPDSVTAMGDYAFSGCSSLTSITLPDSLTSIEDNAFSGCSSLTSITIPDNVTFIGYNAFYNCDKLTTVNVSENSLLTSIGSYAFYNCDHLTTVNIAESSKLTSIGSYAFLNCSSLSSITLPDSLTAIADNTFSGCSSLTSITIPDSVTSIGYNAFYDCDSLTTVNVSENSLLTSIGSYAFYHCDHLTNVNIAESSNLTSIGEYAFRSCSSLTSITIPDSVTSIGEYAFYYCSGLTSIALPDGITSIGEGTFQGCSALTSIAIPDKVTSIGAFAFFECSSLESITFPDGLLSIGESAFYFCRNLTSVTLPDSITDIDDCAFHICEGLTSINIPDSVSSIKYMTFSGCSSLTSITIPEGVLSIEEDAFVDCSSLKEITFEGACPEIANDAFSQVSATAYYPSTWETVPSETIGGATKLTWMLVGSTEDPDEGGDNKTIAASGECGANLTWTLDEDGLLTISGTGDMDSYDHYTPWHEYRNDIYSIVIGDGVTSIVDFAFDRFENVTNVTIPDSMTSIGARAFNNCSNLTTVNISQNSNLKRIGIFAFAGCSKLASINLPDNTEVAPGAFYGTNVALDGIVASGICGDNVAWMLSDDGILTIGGNGAMDHYYDVDSPWDTYCDDIRSVVIGEGVTSIGMGAFYNYNNLTNVIIADSITEIGAEAFWNCQKLSTVKISEKSNLKSIGSLAFDGCKKLTAITIPSSVTEIGWGAFYSCENLTSITIPSGVKKIEDSTFSNCTNLTSVTIPGNVTEIGWSAFSGCEKLTSVKILSGVRNIERYAFSGCKNLTSVTIPGSVQQIGNSAFVYCEKLATVIIPNGVQKIEDYTFSGCINLTSITIPNSVQQIGEYAFSRCEKLKSVTIPSGVKKIESCTFYNCSNLSSITIPASITQIGDYAFGSNNNLKKIIFKGNLPTIAANSFKDVTATAYYPDAWKKVPGSTWGGAGKLTWVISVTPPAKVSGLAHSKSTASAITLKWNKVTGATGYIVYRKDGSSWTKLGTTTDLTYTNSGLKSGTTYQFAVKAYKTYNGKTYSGNYITINASTNPAAVTGLALSKSASDSIVLKWNKVTGASGYLVYVKDGSSWKKLTNTTSLTYTHSGLKSGAAYEYAVKAYRKVDGKTYNASYPTLKVSTCPAKVSGLAHSKSTTSAITLKWNKVTGATGYIVYRLESGKWVKQATTTNLTYTNSGLKAGTTYQYAVKAYRTYNGKTYNGEYPTIKVSTNPAAVTGLALNKSTSDSIVLKWNKVTGASGYLVYVKDGSSWKKLTDTTSLTYTHSGLESGTAYEYAVKAYRKVDGKTYNASYPTLKVSTCPAKVSGLALSKSTTSAITLKWNKVTGATGYIVYRLESGKWVKQATTTNLTYTNSDLKAGTTYQYAVKAYRTYNGKTYNGAYPTIKLSTNPAAVTGLKATTSTSAVKLTWNKVTGATGYLVYRKNDAGKWVKIADTTTLTYTNTGLASGTAYEFTVKPYRVVDGKTYNGTYPTLKTATVPAAVTNLKASSTTSSIKLSWSKVNGATGYIVYRLESGKWVKLATTTGTSYTNSGLKIATEYKYAVKAYKTYDGKTYNAAYPQLLVSTLPAKVTNLKANSTDDSVTLTWSKVSGAEGYSIYRKAADETSWTEIQKTTELTYTDEAVNTSTEYSYYVAAYIEADGVYYHGA